MRLYNMSVKRAVRGTQGIQLKLHLFDLLWICCTTCGTANPQQTTSCTANPLQIHNFSTFRQIHNISTCQIHSKCTTLRQVVELVVQQIHSKSTTSRTNGVELNGPVATHVVVARWLKAYVVGS
jgi:hypothetical protein